MKNDIGFFNIKERQNGNIIWNGVPVEKTGDDKLKINDKIYQITPGVYKILNDKSNTPMKKLNDKDREKYTNFLKSFNFEKHKAIRGESKSSKYKIS